MFYARIFLHEILAPKITKLCFGYENFGAKKFCTKNARINVDEIDSWHTIFMQKAACLLIDEIDHFSQFHQHFNSSFFPDLLMLKN